jgi:hypothetical protein
VKGRIEVSISGMALWLARIGVSIRHLEKFGGGERR